MCNLFVVFILAGLTGAALAETPSPVCPRPRIGSLVAAPGQLRSSNGELNVRLSFRSDAPGNPGSAGRYCYIYGDNVQAPTLRVKPGDRLVLTVKNDLDPSLAGSALPHHASDGDCSGNQMTAASTNLHFHGLNLPPTCHQDEVIHTSIPPLGDFEYRVKIPVNQPAGLYWYHSHVHGYAEAQVLGGASGALVVEGIERDRPEVAGLPERILVLRDQLRQGRRADTDDSGSGPGKDISLNFVPVMAPAGLPAVMRVRPSEPEFWRVLNASADTYFDLEVRYRMDGQSAAVAETLTLIALDGVGLPAIKSATHVLLAPGGRVEFMVTTPPAGIFAQLVTRGYDTGSGGEIMPFRVIANIISRLDAPPAASMIPALAHPVAKQNHSWLAGVKPANQRKLYFSEDRQDLKDPNKPAKYFITLEGETPKVFDMNFKKPDITVLQGTVEEWTIENRAQEAHSFHIHQLHFQVMERDGVSVNEPELRDTIDLPYWDGQSKSYPSVKLRMDFTNPQIVGTFLYHCHILEHEDAGMMGSIQVISKGKRGSQVLLPFK
jgi:FtsP/CotA-like multicopper oxidase with cupredoxin domain